MKYPDPECDFTADPRTPRAEGWAALIGRSDVLIIDCEAAGSGRDAEVTEIAVLNTKGEVVLNTYTLPEGRSAEDAIASTTDLRAAVKVVGHDAAWRDVLTVAGARHWPDVYDDLCKTLREASVVLAYNAAFDKRLVEQTTERQIGFGLPHVNWRCLMLDYARWRGETDRRVHHPAVNADYHRYTLEDAYAREVQRVKQEHRALADCHLALGLMRAVVAPGKGRGVIATAVSVNAPPKAGALLRFLSTLAENVPALPVERYRVEKYLVADPADGDGDCIDDITELGDPVGLNPVNPAAAIALTDGAVTIPDQDTIGTLFVAGRYGKFVLFDIDTDTPGVYFMNTHTHPAHQSFLDAVGLEGSKVILGQIDYDPNLVAPDGSLGVYYYYYWLSLAEYSFSYGALFYTLLAARMPLLEDNLALYVTNAILPHYQDEWALYKASRINVLFDEDIYPETRRFLALNPGEGYGRLQVLDPADRPHPRDIVLYEALPNELPRVAGIISTVPQTPLSHVNLRAVQDGIPNAFIRDARDDPTITPLIGGFVRYEVTESGYSIRAATPEEVETHYAASRTSHPQTPEFDLSVTAITPPQRDRLQGLESVRRQGGESGRAANPGLSRGNGSRRVCGAVLFLRRVHEGPWVL